MKRQGAGCGGRIVSILVVAVVFLVPFAFIASIAVKDTQQSAIAGLLLAQPFQLAANFKDTSPRVTTSWSSRSSTAPS